MSNGDIIIRMPAGVLSEAKEERLHKDMKIHHHADPTSDELHLIRSKVEVHLRVSGALEMPKEIDVQYCAPESNTQSLILNVLRQTVNEDGTWTPWLPVKLNDLYMKVKSGQRIRQRVQMRWNRDRLEGQVVEFQI